MYDLIFQQLATVPMKLLNYNSQHKFLNNNFIIQSKALLKTRKKNFGNIFLKS